MKKSKFILYAEKDGLRKYVFFDATNGRSVATDDISLATVFPSKFLCNSIIKVLQPVIKKDAPGCTLGVLTID